MKFNNFICMNIALLFVMALQRISSAPFTQHDLQTEDKSMSDESDLSSEDCNDEFISRELRAKLSRMLRSAAVVSRLKFSTRKFKVGDSIILTRKNIDYLQLMMSKSTVGPNDTFCPSVWDTSTNENRIPKTLSNATQVEFPKSKCENGYKCLPVTESQLVLEKRPEQSGDTKGRQNYTINRVQLVKAWVCGNELMTEARKIEQPEREM